MTGHLLTAFGFAIMIVILAAVLGAVHRREKFAFVAGVVLLAGGPLLVGTLSLSEPLGAIVALVGFLAIVASTVPLLGQSPTTA